MMNVFAEMQHHGLEISTVDISLGVVSFFTVALGGFLIGVVMGVLTALITKTTAHVRGLSVCLSVGLPYLGPTNPFGPSLFNARRVSFAVVEPLAVFGMAMLSYLTAELFHFSGLLGLIACGLVQAHYSFKNISKKSYTTVKYFIKMLR